MRLHFLVLLATAVLFSGCLNLPTPESQITAAYVSPLKYKKHSDDELIAEVNSLSRRESQLKIAQNQRMKTSKTKAFWYGFGDGDGIEASELANIRGSIEAARRELEVKGKIELLAPKP